VLIELGIAHVTRFDFFCTVHFIFIFARGLLAFIMHDGKGGKLVNNNGTDKWYILVCFLSHWEADCLTGVHKEVSQSRFY